MSRINMWDWIIGSTLHHPNLFKSPASCKMAKDHPFCHSWPWSCSGNCLIDPNKCMRISISAISYPPLIRWVLHHISLLMMLFGWDFDYVWTTLLNYTFVSDPPPPPGITHASGTAFDHSPLIKSWLESSLPGSITYFTSNDHSAPGTPQIFWSFLSAHASIPSFSWNNSVEPWPDPYVTNDYSFGTTNANNVFGDPPILLPIRPDPYWTGISSTSEASLIYLTFPSFNSSSEYLYHITFGTLW